MRQIHRDVRAGNIDEVTRALESGVEVDARDPDDDYTLLMAAVTSANAGPEMVSLLLGRGAEVNAVAGEDQESVLALAVREGTNDKIELLLEAGADTGYERECGYNVLIDAMHSRAMQEKEPLLPLVELLLRYGASPQGESDYGESALSVASHVGRFDVVERLLEAGADARLLEWDELLYAVALGSAEDVERLLEAGADLTTRDRWERTAWLLSLQAGELEKARLLLAAGADLNERGHCGYTALMHAIENEQGEVLRWLIAQGVDLDAQNEFGETALMKAAEEGATEAVRLLLQAGADIGITDAPGQAPPEREERLEEILKEIDPDLEFDPAILDFSNLPGDTAIAKAANPEIARLLVEAGAEPGKMSPELRAQITNLEYEGEVVCSLEEYVAGKVRSFGTANPERMAIPFWQAMVRSGATAYAARATFDDTGNYEDDPVWSFHRFGKSFTELPDGRIIEIGGEHEDYYDTDFCIYNEVFVHYGGGRFEIFGYPEKVFPPTDFHSATLVGDFIYIIGCLGYPEDRHSGKTPVYRLNCKTLAIEEVKTKGDNPGWISDHKAVYEPGDHAIRVTGGRVWTKKFRQEDLADNMAGFILDLDRMRWERSE